VIFCELQITSHKNEFRQGLKAELKFLYKEESTTYRRKAF